MKIKIIVFIFAVCTFTTAIISCNNRPNRVYFTINPENRQIVFPVYFNDSTTAKLGFDTGCQGVVLDSSFYAMNPCIQLIIQDSLFKTGSAWSFSDVTGSLYTIFQTITIGQVNLSYQYCRVFNFRKYNNTDVDGIIGIPFKDTTHVWELNFDNNYLEIHQIDDFEMPSNCFLIPLNEYHEVQFPMHIEFSDGDTMTVNGKFFVDTGMPQDIVLAHPTKEELEFFNKRDDAIWISTGSGVYFRYSMKSTFFENFIVDSLRIYTLDNPRRIKQDRLIGQNFLKRFNVFFDLKNKQLGLQPVQNFQRIVNPNHKRYCFSHKITSSGQRVVAHIARYKGNPFYEAGVKEGDEVYTLNDIPLKSLTLQDALEMEKEGVLRWVFLRDNEKIFVINSIAYDD